MRNEIISLTLTTGEEIRAGNSLKVGTVPARYSGTQVSEIRKPDNTGRWFEVDWKEKEHGQTFTNYVNPDHVVIYIEK